MEGEEGEQECSVAGHAVHEMMLPTFRVFLPASVYKASALLYRQAQRFAS